MSLLYNSHSARSDVFQNKDYVQKTAIEGTRSGVPEGDSIAPQTGILVEKIFRAESA